MLRKLMLGAIASAANDRLHVGIRASTAAEAKAMLDKAVAAVKADKAKAITSVQCGNGRVQRP